MKNLGFYVAGIGDEGMRVAVRDAKRNGPNWTWLLTRTLGLSFAGRQRQAQRCPSWNIPEIVMIARYNEGMGCTQLARDTGHSRFGLSSGLEFLGLLRSKGAYLNTKRAQGAVTEGRRQGVMAARLQERLWVRHAKARLRALRKRLIAAKRKLPIYNRGHAERVLKRRSRHAMWVRLKRGCDPQVAIRDYGITIEGLRAHIEAQWQPGMTWDNHSIHGWHIDHIKPCVAYDLSLEDEWKKCFHYTNMQPLWAVQNWSKNGKYPAQ